MKCAHCYEPIKTFDGLWLHTRTGRFGCEGVTASPGPSLVTTRKQLKLAADRIKCLTDYIEQRGTSKKWVSLGRHWELEARDSKAWQTLAVMDTGEEGSER